MTKEYLKKHGVSMVLPAATQERLEWLQFQLNSAYALLMGAMRDEQVKDIFARRNLRFALYDLEHFVSPEAFERNGRLNAIIGQGSQPQTLPELEAGLSTVIEPILREELQDMQATFDLRWKADMRAIAKWREQTGKELIMPDHADLCVWLLEQLEQASQPQDYRQTLELAFKAMNFMGDILNAHDLAEPGDVEKVTPAFTAVRAALSQASDLTLINEGNIEQASQRIAQLETYISDNLHKKAICGCGDSIEPDTGAVCGTCASVEQASQPQYITWQSPELAHEALSHLADATGAVDQLLVSLDTQSPSYDGGPEYRQAWYCVMTRQFICLATNTALRNVTGWVSAK